MANLVSVLLISFLLNALAFAWAPGFGAFVHEDVLYVTVLGDKCNQYFAGLEVSDLCREDRLTKNYAIECEADLLIYQTQMACEDTTLAPQNFEIELEPTKIAPEARTLVLNYEGETQRVKIKD